MQLIPPDERMSQINSEPFWQRRIDVGQNIALGKDDGFLLRNAVLGVDLSSLLVDFFSKIVKTLHATPMQMSRG